MKIEKEITFIYTEEEFLDKLGLKGKLVDFKIRDLKHHGVDNGIAVVVYEVGVDLS